MKFSKSLVSTLFLVLIMTAQALAHGGHHGGFGGGEFGHHHHDGFGGGFGNGFGGDFGNGFGFEHHHHNGFFNFGGLTFAMPMGYHMGHHSNFGFNHWNNNAFGARLSIEWPFWYASSFGNPARAYYPFSYDNYGMAQFRQVECMAVSGNGMQFTMSSRSGPGSRLQWQNEIAYTENAVLQQCYQATGNPQCHLVGCRTY